VEARLLAVAVSVKSPVFAPGGGPLSRRGRLSEQSLLLLPPVEARGVAVAVCLVKNTRCFCCPPWRRALGRRGRLSEKSLFLLPRVEARSLAVAV
jgi:hypothetical protein